MNIAVFNVLQMNQGLCEGCLFASLFELLEKHQQVCAQRAVFDLHRTNPRFRLAGFVDVM